MEIQWSMTKDCEVVFQIPEGKGNGGSEPMTCINEPKQKVADLSQLCQEKSAPLNKLSQRSKTIRSQCHLLKCFNNAFTTHYGLLH